ncbi:glutathione S-transferase family protein [Sulfitobacter sp. F26204]|uniref:glutathione S-transferase family protein n=1 Tax=Sulfitobacter sp. F26204 TaxID=2996014 RepID=UPI00225E33AE|nr:glutathione S-transferase family protein [Sulfitobacter sp. F26204]MCX7558456.1 glutathione S-transferase family protein [Sulfitobacter sp. F26204]
MAEALTLIGFHHSVYTWVVRFALAEMGLEARYVEADPFAVPPDPVLARYTALRRVPVLCDGGFCLTETAAILRYLDHLSDRPTFQPRDARAAAQMVQIMGLVDADIYPILIRQVFSGGYYRPVVMQEPGDSEQVHAGLQRAAPSLTVLDQIAREGRQLSGEVLYLADFHLAPMLSYALRVPEVAKVISAYPSLAMWWAKIASRPALSASDPLAV